MPVKIENSEWIVMPEQNTRGEEIRKFILQNVEQHPGDIARLISDKFGISRQAANKHLKQLIDENFLEVHGSTRNRRYAPKPLMEWSGTFDVTPELAEDVIWSNEIAPRLKEMPTEAMDIWNHGFTEMFNNAVDHSEGTVIEVHLSISTTTADIFLSDDGIGIFKKIQQKLRLPDERQAALELAKGKFTTAPDKHSGEGIFFTSRMFDNFEILSGGIYFTHGSGEEDHWTVDRDRVFPGTIVRMILNNYTSRSIENVFNQFSIGDDHAFSKTVVPVKLVQYGDSKLVSRSQAKRLVVRFDQFKTVILDFEDVDSVGQAFADEVFRVFQKQHPDLEISFVNANTSVTRMVERAKSHL